MTVPAAPEGATPAAPALRPGEGFLGIVMLDTRFPRLPGDIGHAGAFQVPTNRRVIRGVWPDKVVQSAAGLRAGRVVPSFIQLVQSLQREGALAITTSCGFLVLLQKELQAAVKVPVITSSLMLLPGLLKTHGRVGVLTISATKLGSDYLRAAGVPCERLKDVVVQGVDPGGEFASAILGNRETMDVHKAAADVVAAAVALKQREPALTDVVLECTNMPPYRAAIEAATGLKTWSLIDDRRLFKPWQARTDKV
ncbi:MAG: aspartate/glutamate racemase family protein [Polaromonas sp.]|nr:aspartate/glutamate racemase family protein [Polaromonas sp.]